MTPHLDEGRIQELVDGEIPSSELPPIQAHLAGCAECRDRLEEARGFAAEADRLIETIELTEPAAPRIATRTPRPRRYGRDLAWAATVVFAAGVGYLSHGSRSSGSPAEVFSASARETVAQANEAGRPAPDSGALARGAAPVPDAVAPGAARPRDSKQAADQPAPPPARKDGETRVPATPVAAPALADARKPELRSNQAVPAAKALLTASPDSAARELGAALAGKVAGRLEKIDSVAPRPGRRLGDTSFRLDEIVVTGVTSTREKAAAPPKAPAVPGKLSGAGGAPTSPGALGARPLEFRSDESRQQAAALNAAPPVELTFSEAKRRLGGSLRLIEGLVPVRLEGQGDEVRVVYPLASGELMLIQQLVDGRLTFRLTAPPGFPADSLDRLRTRVRD